LLELPICLEKGESMPINVLLGANQSAIVEKNPSATNRFDIDLTEWLDGRTVDTFQTSVSGPDTSLTIDSVQLAANFLVFTISGGTRCFEYKVKFSVTLLADEAGIVVDDSGFFNVKIPDRDPLFP